MPKCEFLLTGEVKDFERIDNAFSSMKREAIKLLQGATISVKVDYQETIGAGEIPK